MPLRTRSKGVPALSAVTLVVLLSQAGCGGGGSTVPPFTPTTALSGGATTVFLENSLAFEQPASNLGAAGVAAHLAGDKAFGDVFVTPPAVVNPGLGPLFNNASCEQCHVGNGRGRQPFAGEDVRTMLVRLSIPGVDPVTGGPLAAPGFGNQLQIRATFGNAPEAGLMFAETPIESSFGDGSPFTLHEPIITLTGPYTALPAELLTSPRVAPSVIGLGLLEAIPEGTLRAWADPGDADGDGISGRVNEVWDVQAGVKTVGRFGWKANQPQLAQQTAAAYRNDMGVSNRLFPIESAFGQPQDDGRDDDYELADTVLDEAIFYVQTLGVPARRNVDDPTIQRGEAVFHELGCASCHKPRVMTGPHAIQELANQPIQPFTDLLLHDMGPGLADGRPDFLASGSEWRTPPLWGIGLIPTVNNHTRFLHDGRAHSLAEAILWHGGEAQTARDGFVSRSASDRAALVQFLRSL